MSIPPHWSKWNADDGISFTTPPRGIRNANKRVSGIRDSPDSARFRPDLRSFFAETFSLFLRNLGDSFEESRDSSLFSFEGIWFLWKCDNVDIGLNGPATNPSMRLHRNTSASQVVPPMDWTTPSIRLKWLRDRTKMRTAPPWHLTDGIWASRRSFSPF